MRKKQARFQEVKTFTNFYEFPFGTKTNIIFENLLNNFLEQEVILEIGCGKGEYSLGLASLFPEKFIFGLDIKADRIWRGAKTALDLGLKNVFFLRMQADHLKQFLPSDFINEIWITFPDPQPNKPNISKRLTSPKFLEIYKSILKQSGKIHLKTDNSQLFKYTCEVWQNDPDFQVLKSSEQIYEDFSEDPILTKIQTTYEKKFLKLGQKIKYLEIVYKPLTN